MLFKVAYFSLTWVILWLFLFTHGGDCEKFKFNDQALNLDANIYKKNKH